MSIVQTSQFVGKYALTKAFNDGQLKIVQMIVGIEFKYLNELFGVDLCDVFLDEYTTEPRFIKLMTPFAFEHCGEVKTCRGIEQMLLGFVYTHYLTEMQGVSTSVGKMTPDPEAGKLDNDLNVLSFYNESVQDFNMIVDYVRLNCDIYPEMKGNHKLLSYYF